MTEAEVGVDLVHPDDIGVEFPQEDGPWRLANTEAGEAVMLLRFGRRTDLSLRERQAAALTPHGAEAEKRSRRRRPHPRRTCGHGGGPG